MCRNLCDRYRVHLIADEIMVGFGRAGTLFAHEQAGIRPDLLCLSKGITGGYLPLSVVLSTDDLYGAFYDDSYSRAFLHSHSYTGNTLACRAALATLDIFAEDEVLVRNRRFAERFTDLLARWRGIHGRGIFARRGMIWAVDIDSADPDFRLRFSRGIATRTAAAAVGNHAVFHAALYPRRRRSGPIGRTRGGGAGRRAGDLGRTGQRPCPTGRRMACCAAVVPLEAPCGPEALVDGRRLIAFCSNDYLGLANHPTLVTAAREAAERWGVGSGALACGERSPGPHQALEERLAAFVGRERALYFGTGYMANLAIVPALVGATTPYSPTS